MTEATLEADLVPQEATTEEVVETTTDLPEVEKQTDEQKDKPELSEAEKIKYGMQKRIDKQTAKLGEMERQLAEAQAELQKYISAPKTDAPREEDFETTEEFLKAQGRWEALQEQKEEKERQAKADRDAAYQKAISERRALFEEKEAELKKVTPDYDEKVAEVESNIMLLSDSQKASVEFQVFRDMLFSSDNMPALTYELGKNPDLFDKMLTMNPLQIARQIARLELQIENAPKKQHEPVKHPPNPISGKATANVDPDKMTVEEWTAWRNKQVKRK